MRFQNSMLFVVGAVLLALTGLSACTATGSTTVVGGPEGGTPPTDTGPATDTDGGTRPATTDYAALFGPPTNPALTPDTITGLFAGASLNYPDIRLKLSGEFLMAVKCGTVTVGLRAAARISIDSIALLESKTAEPPSGTGKVPNGCNLSVRPFEVAHCKATTEGQASSEGLSSADGCFFLSGTKLNFYGGTLLYGAKLTKLSD